jgi:hypothetical protein
MNVKLIAGVALTGTIAVLGPVEHMVFMFNPPQNEDSDHGVPRVPLGLTTVGSGAFTTHRSVVGDDYLLAHDRHDYRPGVSDPAARTRGSVCK